MWSQFEPDIICGDQSEPQKLKFKRCQSFVKNACWHLHVILHVINAARLLCSQVSVQSCYCAVMLLYSHVVFQSCYYTVMLLHSHVIIQSCYYTVMLLYSHVIIRSCYTVMSCYAGMLNNHGWRRCCEDTARGTSSGAFLLNRPYSGT